MWYRSCYFISKLFITFFQRCFWLTIHFFLNTRFFWAWWNHWNWFCALFCLRIIVNDVFSNVRDPSYAVCFNVACQAGILTNFSLEAYMNSFIAVFLHLILRQSHCQNLFIYSDLCIFDHIFATIYCDFCFAFLT